MEKRSYSPQYPNFALRWAFSITVVHRLLIWEATEILPPTPRVVMMHWRQKPPPIKPANRQSAAILSCRANRHDA